MTEKSEKRGGRPTGAKSSVGVPDIGLRQAVSLIRALKQEYGDSTMNFNEIKTKLGLSQGALSPLLGKLKDDYGLLERDGEHWRISQLGQKILAGDNSALIESLKKNTIFADLFEKFEKKAVTTGVMQAYISQKYKRGAAVPVIVKRFLESKEYVDAALQNVAKVGVSSPAQNVDLKKLASFFELKYALEPVQPAKVSELVEKFYTAFKEENDASLKAMLKILFEHRENKDELKLLFKPLELVIANTILKEAKEGEEKKGGINKKDNV